MKSLALLLLISTPATAQSITPNFTTGSMTQTTTTTQTITEAIKVERFGGEVKTWEGHNVKAVQYDRSLGADLRSPNIKFQIVDESKPWQLEIISRDAGIVETEDITRTIVTDSVTNTLSVFSQ